MNGIYNIGWSECSDPQLSVQKKDANLGTPRSVRPRAERDKMPDYESCHNVDACGAIVFVPGVGASSPNRSWRRTRSLA
jgi:hypothetical protein